MAAKIVVVGSFNMDLTTYMERLPRPGETVHGRRFVTGPGGKGSNQAVAAARLGAEVTFVGRVGMDGFGDTAIQTWQAEGINTRYVVR
ncbi:MAG TPA: PfkB family carbohydrate kinase, partial [Spirillospora sp.]|nr:PfkB family carbohydrate kinase [Spirillospora sp.]